MDALAALRAAVAEWHLRSLAPPGLAGLKFRRLGSIAVAAPPGPVVLPRAPSSSVASANLASPGPAPAPAPVLAPGEVSSAAGANNSTPVLPPLAVNPLFVPRTALPPLPGLPTTTAAAAAPSSQRLSGRAAVVPGSPVIHVAPAAALPPLPPLPPLPSLALTDMDEASPPQ